MQKLILALFLLPGALQAQTPLGAAEFRRLAEGKTLYFANRGAPYGAEQYLTGQRSIWQYADGTCTDGVWFKKRDMICFTYEGEAGAQCWRFFTNKGRIIARADGATAGDDLTVTGRDSAPLQCKAPGVGV